MASTQVISSVAPAAAIRWPSMLLTWRWAPCGVRAEDGLDGHGLDLVVLLGAGAVGGDVVDLLGRDAGVGQGRPHGGGRAVALGVLVGDAEGVGASAVADDLGQDLRPARLAKS